MMTSDALLTGLSGVGALCCVVAFFYALVPIHKANGSKPLLQAIIFLSAIGFIWAGILLYTSLRYPDRLPESGELLIFSLYARVKAILIALTLIFMSFRIRRSIKRHQEGNAH
jgi:hypothetical protein